MLNKIVLAKFEKQPSIDFSLSLLHLTTLWQANVPEFSHFDSWEETADWEPGPANKAMWCDFGLVLKKQ